MFNFFLRVSSVTALSRVLGGVRDILMAGFLGTGLVADAFFAAFRLPNLFRRLFGEGAFQSAFVPQLSKQFQTDDPKDVEQFSNRVFTLLCLILLILILGIFPVIPTIMHWLTPGLAKREGGIELASSYARITLVYLLFIGLVAHLSSLLHTLKSFTAPTLAPVILNLVFILSMLVVIPLGNWKLNPMQCALVLSWSMAIAGGIQLVFLWWIAKRSGFGICLVKPYWDAKIKSLFFLMVPSLFGAGVAQLNLIVGTIIASQQLGALSYLYYADRLNQLPLGIVGIALGTVLLPQLSQYKNEQRFSETFQHGMKLALWLALPAMIGLFLIPQFILQVLFERGQFSAQSTFETARALKFFALGIPAMVWIRVLQAVYFSKHNTKVPMWIAFGTLGLNSLLCVILFSQLGNHIAIAISSSIALWVQAIALMLNLPIKWKRPRHLRRGIATVILAGLGLASYLETTKIWLESWFLLGNFFQQLSALIILILGGLIIYLGLTLLTQGCGPKKLWQNLSSQN